MNDVNVDVDILVITSQNLKGAISSIQATKTMIKRKFEYIGNLWNDRKYEELGSIIHICLSALNNIEQTLLKTEKYVDMLLTKLQEYESVNLDSASGERAISQILQTPSYGNINTNAANLNEFGVQNIENVKNWVKSINPNHTNDPRRNVNCGKCAAAVYNRLNGDTNAVAGIGTYSIEEMNEITGRTQTTMTPDEIESYLISQGAGSHVVVGVDRSSGAGHWFNAYYDGYRVYTIEGQSGVINGWPPDYGNVIHWDASV